MQNNTKREITPYLCPENIAKRTEIRVYFSAKQCDIRLLKSAYMYINRQIDNELLKWNKTEDHKPLLLREARQVGKSSSVRKLAENFDYFIEVNFEKTVYAIKQIL